MNHDEFCPVASLPILYKGVPVHCCCESIDKARVDERELVAQRIEAAAQKRWQRKELPQGMFISAKIAREGKDD